MVSLNSCLFLSWRTVIINLWTLKTSDCLLPCPPVIDCLLLLKLSTALPLTIGLVTGTHTPKHRVTDKHLPVL